MLEAFAYTILISVVGYLIIKLAKHIIVSCIIFLIIILSATLLFATLSPAISSHLLPIGFEEDGRIFVYSDDEKYLIVPEKINSVRVSKSGMMNVSIEVSAGTYIFNLEMNKFYYMLKVKSKLFRSIGSKTYDSAT